MEKAIGLYEYDYSIMVVADTLKERGNKYESYEEMYDDATMVYEGWVRSDSSFEVDWMTSLNEYIERSGK